MVSVLEGEEEPQRRGTTGGQSRAAGSAVRGDGMGRDTCVSVGSDLVLTAGAEGPALEVIGVPAGIARIK